MAMSNPALTPPLAPPTTPSTAIVAAGNPPPPSPASSSHFYPASPRFLSSTTSRSGRHGLSKSRDLRPQLRPPSTPLSPPFPFDSLPFLGPGPVVRIGPSANPQRVEAFLEYALRPGMLGQLGVGGGGLLDVLAGGTSSLGTEGLRRQSECAVGSKGPSERVTVCGTTPTGASIGARSAPAGPTTAQ